MIELYKIVTGKYDSDCSLRLYLRSDIVYASITRGNKFKLVPQHCKYDLRKHYFTNRVVPIWNSLPNDVVMADNVNLFKNHLYKFLLLSRWFCQQSKLHITLLHYYL